MKKEKAKVLREKYAGSFGGKRDEEQPNLFGDQDFVFNVLQTELTDIDDEMVKTREAIDRKKEKLEKLQERKQEVNKAADIVANQRKEVKKKVKKEVKDA